MFGAAGHQGLTPGQVRHALQKCPKSATIKQLHEDDATTRIALLKHGREPAGSVDAANERTHQRLGVEPRHLYFT